MKIRSTLLFACMLVVPLLAMFSHKIPRDLRRVAWQQVWDPARRSITSAFGSTVETPASPAPDGVALAPLQPPVQPPLQQAVVARAPEPVAPAAQPLATRKAIEDRLVELGAFSLECAPRDDIGGLHRCSCRVAADPSGQLQRVFQSADPDPVMALQSLLGQVQFWQQRMAAGLPPTQAPSGQTQRF